MTFKSWEDAQTQTFRSLDKDRYRRASIHTHTHTHTGNESRHSQQIRDTQNTINVAGPRYVDGCNVSGSLSSSVISPTSPQPFP